MRLYISGPMRGVYEFNFPAFFMAAERLRSEGHTVFNPAERDRDKYGDVIWKGRSGDPDELQDIKFDLRDALAVDMDWICRHADAVAMLPGWEKSKGATAERAAALALGLLVFYLHG